MSRRPIRTKEIQNPERILYNLLQDYVSGELDNYGFLYRAAVVKIDPDGGALEKEPLNPKNSIQARIITNGRDKDVPDKDLSVFWPMFPHDMMPLKEGEHVYVCFEDAGPKSHGLWLNRIPEPASTDNPNLTLGTKKYQDNPNNNFSQISADKAVQDSDTTPGPISQSPEFVAETVPKFRARVGDRVIEGSNNTVIILGRDRPSSVQSGQQSGAGSVDIVSGRANVDDLDPANDKSRLVISMNSDPDTDFNISVGPPSGPKASITYKSDEIRVIARSGAKIVVEGGDLYVEAKNVFLGKNATESVIKGNLFNNLWKKVLSLLATHVHLSGPPGQPTSPSPVLTSLSTPDMDLETTNILSKKIKTE